MERNRKKYKNIIKSAMLLMLSFALILSSVKPITVFAKDIEQGKLLILGDDIATGNGLSDYNSKGNPKSDFSWTTLLAKQYVAKQYNYAFDGCTTSDLLMDINKPKRQEMITTSDLICISVGNINLSQLLDKYIHDPSSW